MQIFLNALRNPSEAEVLKGFISKSPFSLSDSIDEADCMVIVTGDSITKELTDLQEYHKPTVIAACFNEANTLEMRRVFPYASFLSFEHCDEVISVVEETIQGNSIELISRDGIPSISPRMRDSTAVSYLPLTDGCSEFCETCSQRSEQGTLISYPGETIQKEIDSSSKECAELHLVGPDIASFETSTIWRSSLPEIISEISSRTKARIVLGRMMPKNVMPIRHELMNIYSQPKVIKKLWLPFLAGSQRKLSLIGYDYGLDDIKSFVLALQQKYRISLKTEFILGPNETAEDFDKDLSLLRELCPDEILIRMRSNSEEFMQRKKLMESIHTNIVRMQDEKWIGWKGESFVLAKAQKGWIVRNAFGKEFLVKASLEIGMDIPIMCTRRSDRQLIAEVIGMEKIAPLGLS